MSASWIEFHGIVTWCLMLLFSCCDVLQPLVLCDSAFLTETHFPIHMHYHQLMLLQLQSTCADPRLRCQDGPPPEDMQLGREEVGGVAVRIATCVTCVPVIVRTRTTLPTLSLFLLLGFFTLIAAQLLLSPCNHVPDIPSGEQLVTAFRPTTFHSTFVRLCILVRESFLITLWTHPRVAPS